MKPNRIWLDLETTGFDSKMDQILEIAAIVDDSEGNEIDRLEIKVKLKHNVIPGPGAVIVNRINPYSKEWNDQAVTENEAAKLFSSFCKKHTTKDGVKPIFTAYNVDFDKEKTAVALVRNGFTWKDHFNRSSIDPLKTARNLVQAGKIQTKIKTYGGGRTSPSSSLEDVVEGLGIKYKGTAHRAMADVEAMRDATKIMFKMATGHELSNISSDPSKYRAGEVVKVITDSKSSGAKIRHILILDNDIENERIVAIDEDDIIQNNAFTKTSVRKFNYGTIVSEYEADQKSSGALLALLQKHSDEVARLTKDAKAQLIKDEKDDFAFDEETRNFELIEKLEKNMSAAKNKKATHDFLFQELTAHLNGDRAAAKGIMAKAEQLGCAKGEESWGFEPINEGNQFLEKKAPGTEQRVGLHPAGHYAVGLIYDKNGRQAKELKESKSKKDIFAFLKGRVVKNAELEAFVDDELPEIDTFKNPKHPAVIETELKNAMDALAVKQLDDNTKAGISGVIQQLQKLYPKTFAKYKFPIDPEIVNVAGYWRKKGSNDDGSGGSAPPASGDGSSSGAEGGGGFAAASGQDPVLGAHDHIKPGEKVSKNPCALCGRPLSAALSVQASMGPTCRKNVSFLESQEGSLDGYTDEYRPFSPGSAPRPGDLVGLKHHSNQSEKEILAEFVGITPSQAHVVDRRKVMTLLKEGISPVLATYLSMARLSHGSIAGISKLKAPRDRDELGDGL